MGGKYFLCILLSFATIKPTFAINDEEKEKDKIAYFWTTELIKIRRDKIFSLLQNYKLYKSFLKKFGEIEQNFKGSSLQVFNKKILECMSSCPNIDDTLKKESLNISLNFGYINSWDWIYNEYVNNETKDIYLFKDRYAQDLKNKLSQYKDLEKNVMEKVKHFLVALKNPEKNEKCSPFYLGKITELYVTTCQEIAKEKQRINLFI